MVSSILDIYKLVLLITGKGVEVQILYAVETFAI